MLLRHVVSNHWEQASIYFSWRHCDSECQVWWFMAVLNYGEATMQRQACFVFFLKSSHWFVKVTETLVLCGLHAAKPASGKSLKATKGQWQELTATWQWAQSTSHTCLSHRHLTGPSNCGLQRWAHRDFLSQVAPRQEDSVVPCKELWGAWSLF